MCAGSRRRCLRCLRADVVVAFVAITLFEAVLLVSTAVGCGCAGSAPGGGAGVASAPPGAPPAAAAAAASAAAVMLCCAS